MKLRTTRRSLLQTVGTAATVAIAGCNAFQNGSDGTDDPENNATPTPGESESTPENDAETEASPSESDETLALTTAAEGTFEWAGNFNDTLTYVTDGNQRRVVYGGSEEPAVGLVTPSSLVGVDDGVAYTAIGEEEGTTFQYLRSGGEELARVDSSSGSVQFIDALNGTPLWTTFEGSGPDGTIHHGTEEIDTGYPAASAPFEVGGNLAFFGHEEASTSSPIDVVVDGVVVNELDDPNIESLPRGIDGEPTYIRRTHKGQILQHGDQQHGREYTAPGDGGIQWFGELDGRLAFIAAVASDRIQEVDRTQEQVLWYDGEEIARHERISSGGYLRDIGRRITMTDDGIAYECADGLAVDGEIIDERQPTHVTTIDGDLAYDRPEENGRERVVYRDQHTDTYDRIASLFELDGDLAILGYTDSEAVNYGKIMHES